MSLGIGCVGMRVWLGYPLDPRRNRLALGSARLGDGGVDLTLYRRRRLGNGRWGEGRMAGGLRRVVGVGSGFGMGGGRMFGRVDRHTLFGRVVARTFGTPGVHRSEMGGVRMLGMGVRRRLRGVDHTFEDVRWIGKVVDHTSSKVVDMVVQCTPLAEGRPGCKASGVPSRLKAEAPGHEREVSHQNLSRAPSLILT